VSKKGFWPLILAYDGQRMKKLLSLAILSVFAIPHLSSAAPLVVYGRDDRIEVSQSSPLWQSKAKSVAVMVQKSDFIGSSLPPRTFKEANTSRDEETGFEISLCKGTKFGDQPNPATCTGFLIAPDLLVTAGHCMSEPDACETNQWVFDFQTDKNGKVSLDIPSERIFSCKKIIRNMANNDNGLDFTLVQLDRVAKGRPILEVNIADHVGVGDDLVLIGSPVGLPLKVAPGAKVRNDDEVTFFTATLDSFMGNSGSPVFNERTGLVEGILVQGEEDFVANMQNMCVEVNVCKEDECRGEDVSRMSSIPEIALRSTMESIARSGHLELLEQIEQMNIDFFVDIYGADRVSPLMIALENQRLDVVKLLLKMKADPNLQDMSGRRPFDIITKEFKTKDSFEEVADLLLKFGGDLEYRDSNSETLLFKAVRNNNLAAVEVLINKNLNIWAKNKDGKTAKDIAKSLKFKPIRKALYRAMYGKGLKGLINSIFKKNPSNG